MISRILERLEDYKYTHLVERDKERLEHCTENDRAEHCENIDCFWCVWDKAILIVQEVAKEYEEKKYYRIVLSCLEDSTSLEMPLTEQEYLFLTRLSDLVYRVATGCMPTMYVEQKGE